MNEDIYEKLENLTVEDATDIYQFFRDNYQYFSPYEDYFYLRFNEYKLIKSLFKNPFSGNKVLEIGCGFGFNSLLLSFDADQVVGIDIPEKYPSLVVGDNATSVEIAKEINSVLQIRNIDFKECWPTDITVCEDESVDMVFSEYVLEHIPDLDSSIKEMHRVLKRGGVMLHVVPITQDAVIQFINQNVANAEKRSIKQLIKNIVRPVIIPACHSEFLTDLRDQMKLYSIENYTFRMQEIGFEIEEIKQGREQNRIILARKL